MNWRHTNGDVGHSVADTGAVVHGAGPLILRPKRNRQQEH